jgi:hypothetical protein
MQLTRLALLAATLLLPAAAQASDLPSTIWSGAEGGFPSITANSQNGVSVTLPAGAVEHLGGGAVAEIAKNFLDKWAPGICSGVFDFQSPHPGMKIRIALSKPVLSPNDGEPMAFNEVGSYNDVTINYEPSRKVTCVPPPDLSS